MSILRKVSTYIVLSTIGLLLFGYLCEFRTTSWLVAMVIFLAIAVAIVFIGRFAGHGDKKPKGKSPLTKAEVDKTKIPDTVEELFKQ